MALLGLTAVTASPLLAFPIAEITGCAVSDRPVALSSCNGRNESSQRAGQHVSIRQLTSRVKSRHLHRIRPVAASGDRAATGAEETAGTSTATAEPAAEKKGVPAGGCEACGRESLMGGCNGQGRIQGGIAVVPGFRWWPIKAFRPCPEFVKVGGTYKRQGQSLDEVAFGRKGKGDDVDITERLAGGKK